MSAEDFMMPCLTKKYFGIDCFGCGTQRAFVMLTEGDFKGAFEMYPAIYSLLVLAFFVVLSIFDRARNYSKILIFLGIANAVIIVVSYFLKHPLPF